MVNDTYVTLTDGTGVVHIAPAFGEDDYRVGRKYNLPVVQLIDEEGKFPAGCGFLTGLHAQEADEKVLADLKDTGKLLKSVEILHSYPFCWRCDTPLIYYARSSWFIKVTAVKDRLIAANRSVNWMPETIKEGRMGNFLENVIDWGLSRDRYWGTPLPVWVCEDCGEITVIGSKAELKEKCGVKGDIELHRPYLDNLTCKCGKCGGKMKRTPEVIDCWFDSGSMPFAQYHYPFENADLFHETFPADFISEAVDQTRGWFYTLLVISTILFDRAPFKNCIVLGGGRGALVFLYFFGAVDSLAFLPRSGERIATEIYGHAVEHLRVLLPVCGHRQIQPFEVRSEKMQAFADGQVGAFETEHACENGGQRA